MLTPDFLENCADDIVRLYAKLDESITRDIARRICKTGFVTDTADWQAQMLAYSGRVFDDVIEDVAEYSDISSDRLRELFKNSINESMKFDSQIYVLVGKSLRLSEIGLQVLNAGFMKTNGDLKNLTMTTANTSQTAYINACTLAEMQITSGAFSYTTAIRNAIKSAIGQGTEVLYPSGHKDKLDVAVRRSVMTGVSQTAGKVSLQNAIDMDCDLMEITAHSGARPSHADWQGKIVSLSGRKGYLSTSDIGYGDGAGFKGWNCRHDWFPFFEGISKPNYTQKELDALQAKDTEYNCKMYTEYEASQMQRKQEREIRATRRELAGLDEAIKNAPSEEVANALKEDFQKASVKLKNQENKLKDFCNQTGLPNEKDRIQVYGFGKSTSQKAVQANKKFHQNYIDIFNKSDMIDKRGTMSNYDVRKWYNNENKKIPSLIDKTKTIEEQARQACEMRNANRFIARELMADTKAREKLDISDPIVPFKTIVERKMERKNMSYNEAVEDIIHTSNKTRKSVNKAFGLE